jgi:hypothetical protein
VVDSSVQSLYFVRDSIYGTRIMDGETTGSDMQREIIKQLRQKVTQLQQKITQIPPEQKH